ncbi:hypothetical protein EDC04DRAFT_305351 [Pisolithus marmoratus]|nr:hypothetical protein EDC04DRAFT_305351 [Pisolithus marmoratus]
MDAWLCSLCPWRVFHVLLQCVLICTTSIGYCCRRCLLRLLYPNAKRESHKSTNLIVRYVIVSRCTIGRLILMPGFKLSPPNQDFTTMSERTSTI